MERITESTNLVIFQEWEHRYINDYKRTVPPDFFSISPMQRHRQALDLFRFVFEEYLGWTPNDVWRYMTRKILWQLKLDIIFRDYVTFPLEYSKDDNDLTYLAYLMYPKQCKLNFKDDTLHLFSRVINGELKKIPSSWVESGLGATRFAVILQYILLQMPQFKNQEELYAYFAAASGAKILKQYKIYYFAMALYPSPLEALHNSLPEELKSEYWFDYFRDKKK